jgi:hypothetical protein
MAREGALETAKRARARFDRKTPATCPPSPQSLTSSASESDHGRRPRCPSSPSRLPTPGGEPNHHLWNRSGSPAAGVDRPTSATTCRSVNQLRRPIAVVRRSECSTQWGSTRTGAGRSNDRRMDNTTDDRADSPMNERGLLARFIPWSEPATMAQQDRLRKCSLATFNTAQH